MKTETHTHSFSVDTSCECGIQLSTYVRTLKADNARLRQWLAVVLDQVDYTNGACSLTEMVGAVLDKHVIDQARAALAG